MFLYLCSKIDNIPLANYFCINENKYFPDQETI